MNIFIQWITLSHLKKCSWHKRVANIFCNISDERGHQSLYCVKEMSFCKQKCCRVKLKLPFVHKIVKVVKRKRSPTQPNGNNHSQTQNRQTKDKTNQTKTPYQIKRPMRHQSRLRTVIHQEVNGVGIRITSALHPPTYPDAGRSQRTYMYLNLLTIRWYHKHIIRTYGLQKRNDGL